MAKHRGPWLGKSVERYGGGRRSQGAFGPGPTTADVELANLQFEVAQVRRTGSVWQPRVRGVGRRARNVAAKTPGAHGLTRSQEMALDEMPGGCVVVGRVGRAVVVRLPSGDQVRVEVGGAVLHR